MLQQQAALSQPLQVQQAQAVLQDMVLEQDEVAALHTPAARKQHVDYILKVLRALSLGLDWKCLPSCPAAATMG